jgi:hypothetical protein
VAAALSGGGLERRRPGGGCPGWRRPGGAAAWRGSGLERRRLWGGCQEAAELGLAEAKKEISDSDYHVRGDGLQWNWMSVLLNGGYNI